MQSASHGGPKLSRVPCHQRAFGNAAASYLRTRTSKDVRTSLPFGFTATRDRDSFGLPQPWPMKRSLVAVSMTSCDCGALSKQMTSVALPSRPSAHSHVISLTISPPKPPGGGPGHRRLKSILSPTRVNRHRRPLSGYSSPTPCLVLSSDEVVAGIISGLITVMASHLTATLWHSPTKQSTPWPTNEITGHNWSWP